MSVRIAFASTDGTYIDQHFGSARLFHIFDVSETSANFAEIRRTQALCNGNCEGGFDHLLSALSDCNAVFVLKIGQGAAAYMIAKGKRVFEAQGPVEEIIERIVEENLLGG